MTTAIALARTAGLLTVLILLVALPPAAQAAESSSLIDLSTLKRNARQGSETDQFILGRTMVRESKSDQELQTGLEWLKRSARQGYPPALLYLAEIYEQGRHVNQDFVKAQHWYARGAEEGLAAAKDKLAPLEDIDPEKDFVLFGVPFTRATRFILRYALQKRGGQFLKPTVHGFCDRFSSQGLLRGTDQLQACYTHDQRIAQVTYRFPSPGFRNGTDDYMDVFEKLESRYGPADRASDGGSSLLTWQASQVRIHFWLQPGSETAFLRYLLPDRVAAFQQRLRAEATSDQPPSDDNL
jgi:hypothetical protein